MSSLQPETGLVSLKEAALQQRVDRSWISSGSLLVIHTGACMHRCDWLILRLLQRVSATRLCRLIFVLTHQHHI